MCIRLAPTGSIENHNELCRPEELKLTKNALSVEVPHG
jgi:hypothetical protein